MEIDNSNIPSGPNSLTLLFAANGKSLAKHFRRDGSKKSYDNAYLFIQMPAPVGSISVLQDIMRFVSQHEDKNICLIRGAPRRHIPKDMLHRRTLENYQDVPRAWVILDIDDLPLPEGMLPTSQEAVTYAVSKLPACFHDRDYVYHFSSSAGLGGQVLKCHLAFMLTEPVSSNQLHRWARNYVNPDPELVNIDAALFNAVQVHYLADPVFDNPSMDPFAGGSRIGLITGTQRMFPPNPRPQAYNALSVRRAVLTLHCARIGLVQQMFIRRARQPSRKRQDRGLRTTDKRFSSLTPFRT